MSDQQQVDVPSVVQQLKHQVEHLEKNVLAYGDLARGTTPIVSWTTRSGDVPLEIMTDLGALGEASKALVAGMAESHAQGIRDGLNDLQSLLNVLHGVMTPVQPAPAPAPQPQPASLIPAPQPQPQLQPPPPPLPPVATGPMAGPAAANVLPVPAAPPLQQQAPPPPPLGETLVPPGQGGPGAT